MLVNEYKLYVLIQKSSKDAKFGQCLYLGVPLCYEQNGVEIIFNILCRSSLLLILASHTPTTNWKWWELSSQ
jgi:hypothetical protein